MTDIFAEADGPILSPAFAKARKLSRVLSVLFAIFFGLTLFYLLAIAVLMVVPKIGAVDWQGALVPLSDYPFGNRLFAGVSLAIGVLPGLFLLHHARKLFGCFAKGEVFSAQAVGHIRAAGLWLVLSACAEVIAKIGLAAAAGKHPHVSFDAQTIVFGAATFVAAYVMAEARRIADENASIL